MKSAKLWSTVCLLALTAMTVSACGAPKIHVPHSPYVYNAVIDVAVPPITNINPVTARGAGNRLYQEMVYQTLVGLNPPGKAIPGLALSWHHNRNATHWAFTLNPYAKWWNGHPVTARAVAWTLAFDKNPASGFVRRRELDNIATTHVLSATRLTVDLKHPDPDFVANVMSPHGGIWILPSFLLDRRPLGDVRTSSFLTQVKDVMGSGPFRPYRTTKTAIYWEANPHYFLGAPRTKYLLWSWGPSVKPTAETPDIRWSIGTRVSIYRNHRRTTTQSHVEWAVTVHSGNHGLTRITWASLISAETRRQYLPGFPVLGPGTSGLGRSLTQAGYLLRKGRWVNSEGTPLHVTLLEPKNPFGRILAADLAHQWREAGLAVTLSRSPHPHPVRGATASLVGMDMPPKPEPLPQFAVPIVWARQYWSVSPRIAEWIPNVWQPFYKVDAWRVRSIAEKVRQ